MEQSKLIINRYRIINKLGQGGMGVVWRVYDRLEQQEVALKQVLIPETQLDFASKAGTDDTDKLRLSLAQEFSILATLRHPHILSVLDFGFDEQGHPFYTMTLLEGATDCKTYGINLSRERRIVLIGQMLQALHYLHRRGVLHRDLKPDNVFVTRDEQIKVMDFGLAKLDRQGSSSSRHDTIKGTISYMAPELFQGESASVASDLFAIGVMVYEIMAGKHPFDEKTIGKRILKIMMHTPDFSPFPADFVPWLRRILEKDPAFRYATTYDAIVGFYDAVGMDMPTETQLIRESFLQASQFVGRSNELDTLRQALHEAQSGHGSVWLISGESGVGKSRLMEELRIHAMVAGALVLRGNAVEEGGLPLQIWRGVARGLAISVDDISDNEAGVLKQIVPNIDDFLGHSVQVAPPLIGGAATLRLHQIMMQLVERHKQTVVLLLDDLHWVSDVEAWLERIAELVPKQRLLMIGSYRSDERPHFAEGVKSVQSMPLPRLQREDIRRLSASALGASNVTEALINLLEKHSQGNVTFIVESLRLLADEAGSLEKIGQTTLPDNILTEGMRSLSARRISRVPTDDLELLQLAALAGHKLDLQVLRSAAPHVDLETWLLTCKDIAVLEVIEDNWHFSYDTLRIEIQQTIDNEAYPHFHRRIAHAVEAVYPDNPDYDLMLHWHWHSAGEIDREIHYLIRVAEDLIYYRVEIQQAHIIIQRTLSSLKYDDPRRLWPLLWLSAAHIRQGHNQPCNNVANEALEIAHEQGDARAVARAQYFIGLAAFGQGHWENARSALAASIAGYRALDDALGTARSLHSFGWLGLMAGFLDDAEKHFSEAVNLYEVVGDVQGYAELLRDLGSTNYMRQEFGLALQQLEKSIAKLQEIRADREYASAIHTLGMVHQAMGDYALAQEKFVQSTTICTRIRYETGIIYNHIGMGLSQYYMEDFEAAEDWFKQALQIALKNDELHSIASCYKNLAFTYRRTNDLRAVPTFVKALSIARALPAPPLMLDCLIGLAWQLLDEGKLTRAAGYVIFAEQHPTRNTDVQRWLNEIRPALDAMLSDEEFQQSKAHAEALDLDTVAAALLAEFGSSEDDTP